MMMMMMMILILHLMCCECKWSQLTLAKVCKLWDDFSAFFRSASYTSFRKFFSASHIPWNTRGRHSAFRNPHSAKYTCAMRSLILPLRCRSPFKFPRHYRSQRCNQTVAAARVGYLSAVLGAFRCKCFVWLPTGMLNEKSIIDYQLLAG